MKGILIAIEGIDGSGKGTQANLLFQKLQEKSIPAKLYSFPGYEKTFFGEEIGAFLRGEFGTLEQVHPKLASILFAGDRFEQKNEIEEDLKEGVVVICDRYVDSNIAHQCAKRPAEERQGFAKWLETLEYSVFSAAKPDITFFLDVPLDISKELVLKKGKRSYTDTKEDIHESSYEYLDKVYETYMELWLERQWVKIRCTDEDGIKGINEIGEDLSKHVLNRLGMA
ncbi:dTMP kinase [Kushneria konosiri]|uniref:Thymidylate kinase n=1 Tax=Kushneria konosiri TaxID=698828 RepID=A0A2Z2HIQ2_9GAMM|nr:dTMP kinase [Kushneria konosiri]ARS53341.1 dTMP kinase [Kushneria konosiri]